MIITRKLANLIIKHELDKFYVKDNKIAADTTRLSDQYVNIVLEFEYQGNLDMPDGCYLMHDFPDLVTLLMGKNFREFWDNDVDVCKGDVDLDNKVIEFKTIHGTFTQSIVFKELEDE